MKDRLLLAVERNIISMEQVEPLLNILTEDTEDDKILGNYDFSHLFWFVGVLLLIFAVAVFTIYIEEHYHGEGVFYLSIASFGFLYAFSRRTYKKGMLFLSALLLVCAVIIFPITAGLFVDLFLGFKSESILDTVLVSLLLISTVFLFRRKFPLLIVGTYIGTLGLFLRITEIDLDNKTFWLIIGLVTTACAWILNLKYTLNYAFWLNKFSVLEIGYGASIFVNTKTGALDPQLLALSIFLLLLSVYLRYQSFAITGITGILTYVNYLVFDVYDNFLWASIAIGAQALLIIFLASFVYKRREQIDELLTSVMPSIFIRYRPTPQKEPLSYGV